MKKITIEKLKLKDLKEAAKVYYKGLQMEIPKGRQSLDNVINLLGKIHTFVYKENGKIRGLVTFELRGNKIRMNFICAMVLRRGIGEKLMKKLVDFAMKNKVRFIYSSVSSKDKRVMIFYDKLGFKRYSSYSASRNFIIYRIKARPEDIRDAILR